MTTPNMPWETTTPGDLPQGVLYPLGLGGPLQNPSAAKFRQLAASRFPAAVGDTSAGDPGNVGGPLGFIVDLSATLFEHVATADPSTITGPDDLLPLITDFFEGLPLEAGIYLLALLLSWLTDTDPEDWDTAEEIQANLIPALARLPLRILGLFLGGGDPGELDDATRDALGPLVGGLSDIVSLFAQIQAIIDGILQTLRGIPVVGGSLSDMLSGILALKASQDGTAATIGQLGGASLAASPDSTADFTLAEADATGTVTATATSAPWAIVRVKQAAQKTSLMWLCRKVGVVSSFRLDVYRIDPATGVATRLYTTDEVVSLLSGSDAWAGVVIPPIIMQRDDVIGVQCRMTGAGSVVLKGLTTTAPSRPSRPYYLGAARNPSADPAPDTISAATMDALYVSSYPMIHIGSLTSFTAAPGSAPRTIADYFSSDLSSWLLKSTASGTLAVTSGQLSYGGGADGFQSGIYQLPLSTDDWDCQAQLMNNSVSVVGAYIVVASDSAIKKCVVLQLNNSGAKIFTVPNGFGGGGETERASGGATGGQGGVWIVTYRSATATYRVYKGDTSGSPVAQWTDTGGAHPVGLGQRYFGLALNRSVFTNAGPWDNFVAQDITP